MLTIDGFIDRLEHLPSAPRVLAEISVLVQSPDIDVKDVVNLIEQDPGLAAEVMRRCNSAYLGSHSPASDLLEAVSRLGLDAVYQLTVSISGAALFPRNARLGSLDLQVLWRHSVTVALIGRMLAESAHENGAQVFTACILHDLGKVVLALGLGDEYEQILSQSWQQQAPTVATELAVLGFDHAQVGGRLLERWSFAAELAEAVRFHHFPAEAPAQGRLAAFVLLADLAATMIGYDSAQAALSLVGREQALELAGLSLDDVFSSVVQGFESVRERQITLTSLRSLN